MALTRIKTDQILDGTITGNDIDAGTNITASDYRIGAAYPTIKPSLNLDFANTKSLDPRIDFDRSSTATYYDGQTFAKAEENLLLYSQEFDNAPWFSFNGEIDLVGGFTAPDGSNTAYELTHVETGATFAQNVTRNVAPGETYVVSVWIRNASTTDVKLRLARFGSGSFEQSNTDLTISSEWQRVSVSHTFSFSQEGVRFDINNSTSSVPSTVEIWGAQIEQR